MSEPGLSEIITTTLRNRQKSLRDNITNNNAVLKSMEEYDGLETESGGRTIIEEMFFDEVGTFLRYDGGQVLNTSYTPTMTSAEYDWKQFAASVVITGREERQNGGSEGLIKLLSSRIKAAEMTLENNYNSDLLSSGTADGGKQIGGLAHIVSKTPSSGSVGGIDRGTTAGAFYKNLAFNTASDTVNGVVPGTLTSSTIKTVLNYNINSTTRGMDRIKLLLMGQTHYQLLQEAMQAIQRITDSASLKAGFKTLNYDGIPCVMGGGVSFGGQTLVQADLTYGLNTKFLKVRVHKDANMEPLPELQSINQDAKVQHVVWMGNMTCSAPKLQFVMYDS